MRYYNYESDDAGAEAGGMRPTAARIDLYVFEYGDKPEKRQDLTPEQFEWWSREFYEAWRPGGQGGD